MPEIMVILLSRIVIVFFVFVLWLITIKEFLVDVKWIELIFVSLLTVVFICVAFICVARAVFILLRFFPNIIQF
jgi:hypothetical protein